MTPMRFTSALGVLLGTLLVACSSTTTPTAPTVQAVATQAAPTVQAAATQAAPTIQAVQTQGAPTARALATNAAPTIQALATQVAPAVATTTAQPVRISAVNAAASDATITLQNTGSSPLDLGGWNLQVGSAAVKLPAGLVLPASGSLTLHTAEGASTASDVYLGQMAQPLVQQLKPGAQVVLQAPSGAPATAFTVPSA